MRRLRCISFIAFVCFFGVSSLGQDPAKSQRPAPLDSFAAIHPIDTHVHISRSDPSFQGMLERLNLTVLNILVVDDSHDYHKALQPQVDDGLKLMRNSN